MNIVLIIGFILLGYFVFKSWEIQITDDVEKREELREQRLRICILMLLFVMVIILNILILKK